MAIMENKLTFKTLGDVDFKEQEAEETEEMEEA